MPSVFGSGVRDVTVAAADFLMSPRAVAVDVVDDDWLPEALDNSIAQFAGVATWITVIAVVVATLERTTTYSPDGVMGCYLRRMLER
jgi:hypothetical protein